MQKGSKRALVTGCIVGLLIPVLVIGVGASHTVCSLGPAIGFSGPIASPTLLAIAPPGGFVNASFYALTLNGSETEAYGSYTTALVNSSVMDFEVVNWSLHSEDSTSALGWGSSATCPAVVLVAAGTHGVSYSGSATGPVPAPVAGGVGVRTQVPTQFLVHGVPSAILNETYGASPVGSVDWVPSAEGMQWEGPSPALAALGVSIGPFYVNHILFGCGVTISLTEIRFGVPIQLLNGTRETVPGSFPGDWPVGPAGATNMTIAMTYVFPLTSGGGSWGAYLAGEGGPLSSGGLLFEQTATTNSTD